MGLKILELCATIGTVAGFWMVSENMALGFGVSLLSNVSWLAWAYYKKAPGIAVTNVFLMGAALNGLGILFK